MARKPKWWHVLQDSKNEVRLAVDLYNRSGVERQLEAFIVHMSMGWLKLLQAHFEKSGGDILVRDKRGWRIKHRDGGFKHRSLHDLADEFFGENDPRQVNLDFFTGLRNQIEHRYERDIAALVAGRTQAYLLNYEQTITELFGGDEGLADELRFPLFLSSITGDAVTSLKRVRERVPKGVLEWVQDFDTSIEPGIASDQRVPAGPCSTAETGPPATNSDLREARKRIRLPPWQLRQRPPTDPSDPHLHQRMEQTRPPIRLDQDCRPDPQKGGPSTNFKHGPLVASQRAYWPWRIRWCWSVHRR